MALSPALHEHFRFQECVEDFTIEKLAMTSIMASMGMSLSRGFHTLDVADCFRSFVLRKCDRLYEEEKPNTTT